MDFNTLEKELNDFKENFSYQYFSLLGKKFKKMLNYSSNSQINKEHYILNNIKLRFTSQLENKLGILCNFHFINANGSYIDYDFYTQRDFGFYYDNKKVDNTIGQYMEGIYHDLFKPIENASRDDMVHILANFMQKNLLFKNSEHLGVILFSQHKSHEESMKELLGERLYTRYEKENIEKTVAEPFKTNLQKVKI